MGLRGFCIVWTKSEGLSFVSYCKNANGKIVWTCGKVMEIDGNRSSPYDRWPLGILKITCTSRDTVVQALCDRLLLSWCGILLRVQSHISDISV